jgi:L-asparaginase
MPDTAKFLKAHLKRNDQTIVFTGSMIPLLGFAPSDASFNLGFAISQVNELPNGIYVCMNGAIFSPDEVVKLLYEGRFISVFDESNRKK